jgi:hypothetical protein
VGGASSKKMMRSLVRMGTTLHHCHCCAGGAGGESRGRATRALSSLNATTSLLPMSSSGCMASHFCVRAALRYLRRSE